jgi:CheY-like chemotaxis protein
MTPPPDPSEHPKERLTVEPETLAELRGALARAHDDLEQFAVLVSHDLREPLRVLSGYLSLLEKRAGGQLDDKNRTCLQEALAAATRMSALIDGLLDFSRAGRQTRPLATADAGAALNDALKNLQALLEESGARVTRDPMPRVAADPVQLTHVFQNLVANAAKFRRHNVSPDIHIGAKRLDEAWEFSVRDNGIGIESKDHARLFVLFRRLHGDERPGTGVGLALCKKIIEAHGGRIWFDPSPSIGTTIRFTLPAEATTTSPDSAPEGTVRTVIVDDVEEIRGLIRLSLEEFGKGTFIVVGEAGDGVEAIEAARATQPDLVLLDLSMPHMDGLEALPQIRRVAPLSMVVVFSGFTENRMRESASRLGSVGYIEKGTPPQKLVQKLREIISLHRSRSGASNAAADGQPSLE